MIAKLFLVVAMVESGLDPQAIGDRGSAVGIVQIHKICVDDVNRVAKTNFTYEDRYDVDKSKEIFTLYLAYWGRHYHKKTGNPVTHEVLARIWNGGPNGWNKSATIPYWNKVKKELTSQKSQL